MSEFKQLADALLPAVLKAGLTIMSHYRTGGPVETKSGGSPVTAADQEAEVILLDALAAAAPGVAVIAEEMMEGRDGVTVGDEFFLVDPLDGTREFINGRDEFTVNIGLVRDRTPCFGIIYAPALSLLYMTTGPHYAVSAHVAPDFGGLRLSEIQARRLQVRPIAEDAPLTITASRSHGSEALEAWLHKVNVGSRTNIGSSLKFCQVAEGKSDVYPRLSPTMEWDTAAGHAILLAAGGVVTEQDGSPLLYGKQNQNFLNPPFIASARRLDALYRI